MNYITLEDLLLFGTFIADFVIPVFAVLAIISKKK